MKILDSSSLIDGRILEIYRSGFIEGWLYVPGFVLQELRSIAAGNDPLRRARALRGLDVLEALRETGQLTIGPMDDAPDPEAIPWAAERLVRAARALEAAIVTTDYEVHKQAGLLGVTVLNINELAYTLGPALLPGQTLSVQLVKEGKEPGQGIGYLEDGSMVAVEGGRPHVGSTVDGLVTSVLRTVAGRMIFANVIDPAADDDPLASILRTPPPEGPAPHPARLHPWRPPPRARGDAKPPGGI